MPDEKITALTPDQANFAVRAMCKYINTRQDVGYGSPSSADVDHSSLLYRLLTGQKFLEKPPPTAYSYPCYDLGEGLPYYVTDEVFEVPEGHGADGYGVVIAQSRAYKWVDREKGILEHKNGDKFQFLANPRYEKGQYDKGSYHDGSYQQLIAKGTIPKHVTGTLTKVV